MTHLLVDQLGYKVLFEKRNIVDTNKVKHAFDTVRTYTHAHATARSSVARLRVAHLFHVPCASAPQVPFQLEWTAILLKPVRADENKCQRVK